MKNIRKIFAVMIVCLVASACDEQLDLKPKSAIGENAFYNNTTEVEAAVLGIYDGFQESIQREFAITEMRSDNTKTKSSEGDWAQFETMNVRPTNAAISSYWSGMYNVIFRANNVLENLEAVSEDNIRLQFEGEAKFGRALAHFNLVRAYGAIPKVDRTLSVLDEQAVTRVAVDEILAFVATDLTEAIPNLPARSAAQEGRATVAAAKALLAKVKLRQSDYSGALTLLDEVIADTEYSLIEDYNDVFYNELNAEIIFAIQFLNDVDAESQDFSYEFTQLGSTSGLNYITDDFDAFIDPLETERSAVLYSPSNSSEVGKFITSSTNNVLCGNDWVVLRLADVYLMKAEAILAGAGSTTSTTAIEAYNRTRARSGMSTLPEDGSATLTLDQLLDERRVELAFENHRFYDLVRTGKAEEVLGAFAADNGFAFDATKLLLPIPQREIDTSFGKLKQNPGY